MSVSQELKVMSAVMEALGTLEGTTAQERVLDWAKSVIDDRRSAAFMQTQREAIEKNRAARQRLP